MKIRFRYNAFLIGAVTAVGLMAFAGDEKNPKMQERAYVLSGYIPKFYEYQGDPFIDGHGKQLLKYKDGIASFLQSQGFNVTPDRVNYIPDVNALIITDTPENLDTYERMLRGLFSPEMQLRTIDGAIEAFKDESKYADDRLTQVSYINELTVRSFHNEVRKLEYQLTILPKGHPERLIIQNRLIDARKYRKAAASLLVETLKKQRELIEHWQRETTTTEQGAAGEGHKPAD